MKLYKLTYNFPLEGIDVQEFKRKLSGMLGNVDYSLVLSDSFGIFSIEDVAKDEGREIHLWFARNLPKSGIVRLQEKV